MQVDPKTELVRFFRALGLDATAEDVKAESSSIKITGEDLRSQIHNYSHVADVLRREAPCLYPMVAAPEPRHFPKYCRARDRSASWEKPPGAFVRPG